MTARDRFGIVAGLVAASVAHAAPAPRVPKDAPFCARANARQVFVAPMGQAFRAAAGDAYPSAHWFDLADADHDGAVDRAEFVADARRFFATIDLDHDGRLSPEEVSAYERDVAPEIALFRVRGEPDTAGLRKGSASYAGPLGAGHYAWLNIPEPVASADADIDRTVSAAEFADAAARRFDALDTARDGRLRLAALSRTPQQAAIEGPCRPRPKPKRGAPHGPFDDPVPGADPEETPR